ncbi:uncharacterized protein Z520_11108 [Fonsecaea multimorphosa CBS 102226]|uniref:Uncharacterized protein n=1 Tax=Fonsecaea multimorphosa CBS 102226 TaxID=1442371 RepID=A0A0D2JJ83_9EURO|nr:uncharacterized protein Z520_11108 [Fonsecaea multimorphosa CBS 102226]KIX93252.1 hypothetical protein Z520_11108 [Fonsecaea multimorphosa CBS 102226]OAL18482.1 hypothetical protein AYO22_10678 [Fonsecaea multimorphosa]
MVLFLRSDIKFLPPTKQDRPVREQELEGAEIKAHAARISHQKRRWAKLQQQLLQKAELHEQSAVRVHSGQQPNRRVQPHYREIIFVLHGSSDPFHACPVKITPEVNRIITYSRDVMLPNIFSPPFFRRLTVGGPKIVNYENSKRVMGGSSFLDSLKGFRDMNEGAALAWLCGHIPGIVRLNSAQNTQQLSTARLKMRAKSLRLLRENLAEHAQLSPESLAALRLHIRCLFETECMAGDTMAAKAHADILLRLPDPTTDERERIHHKLIMMFDATELACKKLERTVIPFGNWTAKVHERLWDLASPYVPIPPIDVHNAHPCVEVPAHRDAMVTLRYCLWIAETPLPFETAQEKLKADLIFAWMATKTFHDLGNLINLYMDIMEEKISFRSEGHRLTQACMVLTLIYESRKCVHEAIIENGADVREASHVIMPRLAQDMAAAMEILSPVESVYYQEAYLWMLYAGALHEQRQKGKMQRADSNIKLEPIEEAWFTTTLAKHADLMKVTAWAAAKPILRRFLYDEHLGPDGHLWFEEVVRVPEPIKNEDDNQQRKQMAIR